MPDSLRSNPAKDIELIMNFSDVAYFDSPPATSGLFNSYMYLYFYACLKSERAEEISPFFNNSGDEERHLFFGSPMGAT